MEKTWLERVPSMTAAVSAVALMLSVAHEWGFFFVVGEQWITLLGLKDYLTLAIQWLPAAVVVFVISAGGPFVLERMRVEIQVPPGWQPKHTWKIFARLLLPLPLLLIPLVFFLRWELWSIVAVLLTALLWPVGLFWLFAERMRELLGKPILVLLFFTPTLFQFIVAIGAMEGRAALLDRTSLYSVTTKTFSSPHELRILRIVERGVLVRDDDAEANQLIPWEEVVVVSRPTRPPDEEARPCLALRDWLCSS